jgi:hypothetical protein
VPLARPFPRPALPPCPRPRTLWISSAPSPTHNPGRGG